MSDLADLSQSQLDRLSFIELSVQFLGEVRRKELVARFGIETAAATRDLALYKKLAPGNIDYDPGSKVYGIGEAFKPLFEFPPERVIHWLVSNFGAESPAHTKSWVSHSTSLDLSPPDLATLGVLTRAIRRGQAVEATYHSLSSGETRRQIVPHALVDTGLRWHLRAFDRRSGEFRDFVITRLVEPTPAAGPVPEAERESHDHEWNRIVTLELVPHPSRPHPQITELDYGMVDGKLSLTLRAATAGYVLRKWTVDASPDHSLDGPEYRLWLRDPLLLYGVRNAVIAPGYRDPRI